MGVTFSAASIGRGGQTTSSMGPAVLAGEKSTVFSTPSMLATTA
jgi:hypothetical protein